MRSYYRNILLAAALLSAAAACTKEGPGTDPLDGVPISISATAPETKAMLDADAFKTVGNVIKIYDYVTSDGSTTEHIDAYVTPYDPNAGTDQIPNHPDWNPAVHWPFFTYATDGTAKEYQHYQWIPGNHKFFGWLLEDANMTSTADAIANAPEEFFGSGFSFNETSHVLTIPAKAMTATTPQFDFMYSDVHTRDMDNNPDYKAVPLKFSHLFAAYYFSFSNNSPEALALESITLNIKSSAHATLDYSGTAPKVNIVFETNQTAIGKTYNTSVGAGKTIDVLLSGNEITSTTNISDESYRLIWPQDLADATVDIKFTAKVSIPYYEYNAKGGPYAVYDVEEVVRGAYNLHNDGYYEYVGKGNGNYNVLFRHDARGTYYEVIPEATDQEVSKSIPLASVTSEGKWVAGHKYNYNLSFSNDVIDMTVVVMRWDGGHGGDITFN